MKKLVAVLALGAALSGAAFADTIQNGFGNTFVVTAADGTTLHYHFNPDGAFAVVTPAGEPVASGVYELADGQLCLTPAGGERACTPYVGDKNVGDSWTQTATDGGQISVTLRAGR